jgi:hypothetical protein
MANSGQINSIAGGSQAKSPKVFRKKLDCRRIYEPINLPYSEARNIIEVAQEVIPIIFVPGIMGSRLRDRRGRKVWDPDSKIFMLRTFGVFWQNANSRKKKLVGSAFEPEYLTVIEDDASHNKFFFSPNDRTRHLRG